MIHQHSLQTAAAFERLDDALRGKTEDGLGELIEDLEYLLYKAKEIENNCLSCTYGYDYEPQYPQCNLNQR
jgi:hypothetical protein